MAKNAEKLHIIPPSKHTFDYHSMSQGALRVIDGLVQAGFQAYLVGGSIRDGLLNCQPKDFDVSTDATPEDVKKVFRNARIIGRRFRIVHVRFGL
jgi:poly(A) polymerase